jgi:uncharacterized protein (DUF4415 family)
MNKKPNPTLTDSDAPEWSESEFKSAKRLSEMPADFQQAIHRTPGPQKAPTKIQTTIRFDADVLDGLKATGQGWQTRVNDAMREWLRSHHR